MRPARLGNREIRNIRAWGPQPGRPLTEFSSSSWSTSRCCASWRLSFTSMASLIKSRSIDTPLALLTNGCLNKKGNYAGTVYGQQCHTVPGTQQLLGNSCRVSQWISSFSFVFGQQLTHTHFISGQMQFRLCPPGLAWLALSSPFFSAKSRDSQQHSITPGRKFCSWELVVTMLEEHKQHGRRGRDTTLGRSNKLWHILPVFQCLRGRVPFDK